MKQTCVICRKSRGKRTCQVQRNAVVCPPCCSSIRNQDCEGCRHYTFSQQYQVSKYHDSGTKHFLIEINEEVKQSVDHALELLEKQFFQDGKRIIQNLMQKHPRNHFVQYAMGVYYALKEDYDTALEYFDNAIQIFPYFVEAYFNKAVAYQKKLDIRNMIQAFQKVVEIGNPREEHVRQAKGNLAQFEQHLLHHDGINLESYFKGMDQFEKAFEYMNNQEWEQAILHFKKCIAINPKHPQSYGNMGICYGKLGQKAQALEAFDKALEIDPNYEPAMVNRMVVESLKEGEKLPSDKVESIEYYREYPMKKKSYIQSLLQKLKRQ